MDTVKTVKVLYIQTLRQFYGVGVSVFVRTSRCMYRIGGSVIVMVTLVERSNLVIELIVGMCVYLRFKFAGHLLLCFCVRSELVTEVFAEGLFVTDLCALCQCLLELMSRILHLVSLYILSFIWLLVDFICFR